MYLYLMVKSKKRHDFQVPCLECKFESHCSGMHIKIMKDLRSREIEKKILDRPLWHVIWLRVHLEIEK